MHEKKKGEVETPDPLIYVYPPFRSGHFMAGPDEENGEENGTGSCNSLNITRNMEVNGNLQVSIGDSYSNQWLYMYPILPIICTV